MNLSLFKYNPKNHNWPLIWRTIVAVMLWTLLLSAVESVVLFEFRRALNMPWGIVLVTSCVICIINSLLLRRYVLIISPCNKNGDYRWGVHFWICLCSFFSILWGNDVEHDARAKMFHSKSFAGLTFEEAEYLYIDNPPAIDTARYGQDIKFGSYSKSRGFARNYVFTGYYVAPFCGYDSVFFAIEHRFQRSISNLPLPQKKTPHKIWIEFNKEFNELKSNVTPTPNSHLFQRLRPEDDSNYWFALDYSYTQDSIWHPNNEIHKSVILAPVKGDRMPRWTDKLLRFIIFIPMIFLCLLLCYGSAKTTKSPDGRRSRKSKQRK